MSTTTKVTGLTGLNVQALNELLQAPVAATSPEQRVLTVERFRQDPVVVKFPRPTFDVEVTRTTATFGTDARSAYAWLQGVIDRLPGRGHPRASLHAVARKLVAAHSTPVAGPSEADIKAAVQGLASELRAAGATVTTKYDDEPVYAINVARSGGPAFFLPGEPLPDGEIEVPAAQVHPDIRHEGRDWLARQA